VFTCCVSNDASSDCMSVLLEYSNTLADCTFVSDIAVFVLNWDVKLQPANQVAERCREVLCVEEDARRTGFTLSTQPFSGGVSSSSTVQGDVLVVDGLVRPSRTEDMAITVAVSMIH